MFKISKEIPFRAAIIEEVKAPDFHVILVFHADFQAGFCISHHQSRFEVIRKIRTLLISYSVTTVFSDRGRSMYSELCPASNFRIEPLSPYMIQMVEKVAHQYLNMPASKYKAVR